jgi:hypothetical protein
MGLGDGGVSASDVGAAPLGAGLIFLSVNFPVASFQHDRSARIPPTFLMHARLDLRVDSQTHGLVEPATIMSLDAYQDALGDTADHWSIDPETRAENDSPSV